MNDVKLRILNMRTLKASVKNVLGTVPKAKTLRAAVEEISSKLSNAEYLCGRCGVPVHGDHLICWACGSALSDGEGDEVDLSALRARAEVLGIRDAESLSAGDLELAVEERETEIRAGRERTNLGSAESSRLDGILTSEMPDGWIKRRAKQYVGFWDPDGFRRVTLFFVGLRVLFFVEEGFLMDEDFVEHYDEEERKRRHFGRINYAYVGDSTREVVRICKRIFRRYAGSR